MRLDRECMGHALSLAVVPNLALGQTRVGELSMWKGMAGPQGTKAGIFAAQLAECGVTGLFEPFDGAEGLWAKMLGHPVQWAEESWGEPYSINDTRFKFFPSQGGTQGPTGLAVELHAQVSPEDIAAIHLELPDRLFLQAVHEPQKWYPQTRETADHSIPYLVAVALHDGVVTPARFAPQRMHDPALRSLISKMTIDPNPGFSRRYPDEMHCRLAVTTGSGSKHVAQCVYPQGFPQNPLSDADVEGKFRACCAALLTAQQCDRALELLWSLEDQPNLKALFDTLVV
jgi:2-methylcitrate dehydratase